MQCSTIQCSAFAVVLYCTLASDYISLHVFILYNIILYHILYNILYYIISYTILYIIPYAFRLNEEKFALTNELKVIYLFKKHTISTLCTVF